MKQQLNDGKNRRLFWTEEFQEEYGWEEDFDLQYIPADERLPHF